MQLIKKVCNSCKKNKTLEEYYLDGARRMARCKECIKAIQIKRTKTVMAFRHTEGRSTLSEQVQIARAILSDPKNDFWNEVVL